VKPLGVIKPRIHLGHNAVSTTAYHYTKYEQLVRRRKRKAHNLKQELLNMFRNMYGSWSKAKLAYRMNDES
jgi:hypothetical protein